MPHRPHNTKAGLVKVTNLACSFYQNLYLLLCLSLTGIPPLADHTQLELSVVYNACLCSVACAQFSEAELLLKKATERGRSMLEDDGKSIGADNDTRTSVNGRTRPTDIRIYVNIGRY